MKNILQIYSEKVNGRSFTKNILAGTMCFHFGICQDIFLVKKSRNRAEFLGLKRQNKMEV